MRESIPNCVAFTLTELLVALSLSMLLATFAVFSYSDTSKLYSVKQASHKLSMALERAAALALSKNQVITCTIKQGLLCKDEETRKVLPSIATDPPLTLSSNQLELHFYPSGTTRPSTLLLSYENAVCSIRISLYGRVRVLC